jgi:hypothetical protein
MRILLRAQAFPLFETSERDDKQKDQILGILLCDSRF